MPFLNIFSMFTASKFFWTVLTNWKVLADNSKGIEQVLKNMFDEGRKIPSEEEIPVILVCVSNILKTGVIDIPMIDEYEIALSIDKVNASFSLAIGDAKSGKYIAIPIITKGK